MPPSTVNGSTRQADAYMVSGPWCCAGSLPIVERLAGTNGASDLPIARQNPVMQNPLKTGICGAMTQQYGDSNRGNESAPQKLVQLVGCREPKSRSEPWVRPQSGPAKL